MCVFQKSCFSELDSRKAGNLNIKKEKKGKKKGKKKEKKGKKKERKKENQQARIRKCSPGRQCNCKPHVQIPYPLSYLTVRYCYISMSKIWDMSRR